MAAKFNIRGFVKDIMEAGREGFDIDAGDLYGFMETHGLTAERPLAAEEIANPAGPWHEFGLKEGEHWSFWTHSLKEWLEADDA